MCSVGIRALFVWIRGQRHLHAAVHGGRDFGEDTADGFDQFEAGAGADFTFGHRIVELETSPLAFRIIFHRVADLAG